MVRTAKLCLLCKGARALCGNRPCPLLARFTLKPKIERKISEEIFGPATSIFVGHAFYPNVYVGPMVALENEIANFADNPASWFGKSYQQIIAFRSLLLRSKQRTNVRARNRLIEINQELAMASKPTDVELKLKSKPIFKVQFSDILQPSGPSGFLKYVKLAENPRISAKIEYVINDELSAVGAIARLLEYGTDFYKIVNLFSAGLLGRAESKKLVPTRWSITAVDDIIAKLMLGEIRRFKSIERFELFESRYLDNHFVILLMPGNYEFENFEAWAPGSTWYLAEKWAKPVILEEYEPFRGRTTYAEKQAGGYYAARLAAIEYLHKIRRQAAIVSFREVGRGYNIPLGVWVVRESARAAFRNRIGIFENLNDAIAALKAKLRLPLSEYLKQSKILAQSKLSSFLE